MEITQPMTLLGLTWDAPPADLPESIPTVEVGALSDVAHECEQARDLLSEAMSLRQWEDRLTSAWSDWDVRVEKFFRDEWQREALED